VHELAATPYTNDWTDRTPSRMAVATRDSFDVASPVPVGIEDAGQFEFPLIA
jgi:hypothetical protein